MLQLLADGLIIGTVIALGAIGLTMTYAILRFADFGQGEYLTWGAYLALTFVGGILAGATMRPIAPFSFGWPLILAMVLAIPATAAIVLALDWALYRRLRRHGTAIVLVIASFGAALALRNLLQFIWGTLPDYYTREIQIAVRLVRRDQVPDWLGGLRITPDQLFVLGLTTLLVLATHLFLARTTLGRSMRATAHNPALARVAGVDTDRVLRATWALGAALATVAGVFAGLLGQLRPMMGFDLLLPLFAAAILGGIGSVWGAVLGGLIVGLAESFSVPLVGAEYRAAAAFAVLVAILLVRPTGLFPAR